MKIWKESENLLDRPQLILAGMTCLMVRWIYLMNFTDVCFLKEDGVFKLLLGVAQKKIANYL